MRVLFITTFKYPDGVAMATRIEMEALTLLRSGFDTLIIGVDDNDNVIMYRGIQIRHLGIPNNIGVLNRLKTSSLLFDKIKNVALNESSKIKIDHVVLAGFGTKLVNPMAKLRKMLSCSMSCNETDWFQYHNFARNYRRLFYYLSTEYEVRKVNANYRNVIVISSYLKNYYESKKCNVILFPTIVDFENDYLNITPIEHDKFIIMYFGNAGNKDCLANAIRGLDLLTEEEKSKFEIRIFGTSLDVLIKKQQLEETVIKNVIDKYVFIYKAIPHEDIEQKLKEADFSVLLRRDERCANAGFPTKVAESMACGVPVICNYTSDLEKYVKPMASGVVAENESPEAFAKCLLEISKLTKEQLAVMRKTTRKIAEESFDLNLYKATFADFINNAR